MKALPLPRTEASPPGLRPGPRLRHTPTVRRAGATIGLYVLSIAVALGASALLVSLTGHSAHSTFSALYDGAFKGGASLGTTLDEMTPLLIVALGTVIATNAGIFNIGQEGQLIIGAMFGAAVGLNAPGPRPVAVLVTILAAVAGGALWAGISALLHYWRGVDVVISTLLLVFVAMQVVSWSVNRSYLLREKAVPGQITSPESDMLPDRAHLGQVGHYPGLNFGVGIFVALLCTALVAYALHRTRWGFRLRVLGRNPVVARRAGVSAAMAGGTALVLSGAFAGLAGGVMLTNDVYRIQAGFSNNVGFDGLLVALVARNQPLVALPVAFFFGALRSGGGFLASTGVPRYIVDVVSSLLVLAAVFPPAFQAFRRLRREQATARALAQAVTGVAV